MDGKQPSWRGRSRAPLAVVGVLVALAMYRLFQPVSGDQALGILIGARLRHGAVMYRDVWDIRQPLTYYWFATVGSVLGSGAVAVRLGELFWQSALALLIQRDVEQRGGNRRLGIITALVCVAPLFVLTTGNDVAQPDTLVLLPLYLALRLTAFPNASPTRPRNAVLLGVISLVLALIKILYAPLPFLFAVVWVVAHRPSRRVAAGAVACFAATVIAGIGLVVAYFVHTDVWAWVAHTWFVQGPAMRRLQPPPLSRLVDSASRVIIWDAPVFAAAAVAVVRTRRGRPNDLVPVTAMVWLVAVGAVFLAQEWWPYQPLAALVPVGLLAAPVLDGVLRSRTRIAVALLVVALAAVGSDRAYARSLLSHGPNRTAIEHELEPSSIDRSEVATLLSSPDSVPGNIYVLANPLMLIGQVRQQRIPIHGWSPEFYDETTWDRLTAELIAEPPAYVFVDTFSGSFVRDRAPMLSQWLADHYSSEAPLASGIVVLRRTTG